MYQQDLENVNTGAVRCTRSLWSLNREQCYCQPAWSSHDVSI